MLCFPVVVSLVWSFWLELWLHVSSNVCMCPPSLHVHVLALQLRSAHPPTSAAAHLSLSAHDTLPHPIVQRKLLSQKRASVSLLICPPNPAPLSSVARALYRMCCAVLCGAVRCCAVYFLPSAVLALSAAFFFYGDSVRNVFRCRRDDTHHHHHHYRLDIISPVKPIKSSVWGIIDLHIRRYIRLKTMVSYGKMVRYAPAVPPEG